MKQHEIENNCNHWNRIDSIMDCRTASRSLLPLTPFERWQIKKYGNFYQESKKEEFENDVDQVQFVSFFLHNY